MKKLAVSLALILTLTACGTNPVPSDSTNDPTPSSTQPTVGASPTASPSSPTPLQWPTALPSEDLSNLPTFAADQCDSSFSQEGAAKEISQGWEVVLNSAGQDNHLTVVNEFYDDVQALSVASQPGCSGDYELARYLYIISDLKVEVRNEIANEESYSDVENAYQEWVDMWQ